MKSLLLALVLFAASVSAQDTRGVILGRVTDPTTAAIVKASVRVLNSGTNTSVVVETNQDGNYTAPYLLPGIYRVSVEVPGFKSMVREGVELRTSERQTLDFSLEIGATTESVLVKAEAPMLDAATSTVGITVDAQRVAELPLVGGNPNYFSRITPGFAGTGGRYAGNSFDYGTGSTDNTVDGTRTGSNEVALDGAPNMFGRSTAFALPQDLVQEMRIDTSSYDAGVGHTAGAVVNINMKSGTNRFHGSAYMFDSRLRAVPWFVNNFIYNPQTGAITADKIARNTPKWLHEHWGATLTGPIRIPKLYNGKDRTFFSFGYEGLHVLRNLGFTGTMPTGEERNGDFSALLKLGAQYQIYDLATTATAAGGRFSRQPFPGNIVPANRISPIARNINKYWPDPNQPGTSDFKSNFFDTQDIDRNNRDFIGRLDHNISERHRVFFRINNNYRHELNQTFPSIAIGTLPSQEGYGAVLDDVYTFSSSMLLNVRYGWTFQKVYSKSMNAGFDPTTLGFSQALVQQLGLFNSPAIFTFPALNIDNNAFTALGNNSGSVSASNYHTLGGTFTRFTGNHNIRFGAEMRVMRENGYSYGNAVPSFQFASTYTNGPLDNSTGAPIGQGFAAFLLGAPTGGSVSVNASRATQSQYYSAFIQDDWKLTRRLTVNIGLRYEHETPVTERFNRAVSSFDFQTPNPIEAQARAAYAASPIPELAPANFHVTGGLLFAGGANPRTLWTTGAKNFAPRVGLAYLLTSKTVIRSGYGIFYDVVGADRNGSPNQSGFSQATNLVPTLDSGLTFGASLANPFPGGIQPAPGSSGGLATFLGRAGDFYNPVLPSPYMQRWSLTIQRQLPMRTVLEVGYVGNRGTRLQVTRQLDPIPRQYLSISPERDQNTINFLTANVKNPFANIAAFNGTGFSDANIARSQLLRPFPQFTQVNYSVPAGYSYYHALQAQVEKRFSRGFTFQVTYTYSRFMEATNYLDPTDSVLEKVVSDQDYPQRFVATGLYEFPVGRGRHFGGKMNRLLDAFVGGWQVQSWYEGQAGAPLGFGNTIFRGNLKDIPLPKDQRSAGAWFNVNAGFERSNAKALANNIRTFPSRFTGVRADGINNLDASLFKHFTLTEKLKLQFRVESFNALNHVQFDAPDTNPLSTTFGQITAELGHGQKMTTFALKFLF